MKKLNKVWGGLFLMFSILIVTTVGCDKSQLDLFIASIGGNTSTQATYNFDILKHTITQVDIDNGYVRFDWGKTSQDKVNIIGVNHDKENYLTDLSNSFFPTPKEVTRSVDSRADDQYISVSIINTNLTWNIGDEIRVSVMYEL